MVDLTSIKSIDQSPFADVEVSVTNTSLFADASIIAIPLIYDPNVISNNSISLGDNTTAVAADNIIFDLVKSISSEATPSDSIIISAGYNTSFNSSSSSVDVAIINTSKIVADTLSTPTDSGEFFLQDYFVSYEDYLPSNYIGAAGTF